MLNLVPVI